MPNKELINTTKLNQLFLMGKPWSLLTPEQLVTATSELSVALKPSSLLLGGRVTVVSRDDGMLVGKYYSVSIIHVNVPKYDIFVDSQKVHEGLEQALRTLSTHCTIAIIN